MIEKYKDLEGLGGKLSIQGFAMSEADGKVKIVGEAPYQLEKNLFWDAIKTHAGWENEIAADLKVAKTDIYGIHTVVSGDTLSKIAKDCYHDVHAYMRIFEANKDQLKSPDVIKPGQKLVIPNGPAGNA